MADANDPKRLQIVDAETRAELAAMGMDVRRKALACSDCRFTATRLNPTRCVHQDYCTAYNGWCAEKNPNADCDLWEPNDDARRRLQRAAPQQISNRHSTVISYVGLVIAIASAIVSVIGRCS